MEVSGKRAAISEETLNVCETCQKNSQAALGYCVDCRIYLCNDCYQAHKNFPPCRDHKLLEGEQVPSKKLQPIDICSTHPEEKFQYFCKEHSALACQKCAFLLHRMCKEVCEISKISGDAEYDQRYKEMARKITTRDSKIKNNCQTRLENLSKIDSNKKQAKANITDFCKARHEHLYKLEEMMKKEVDQIGEKDLKSMDKVQQENDLVSADLKTVTTNMEANQDPNRKDQLFITLIKAEVTMETLDDKLTTLSNTNSVKEYQFTPDDRLKNVVIEVKKLGHLSVQSARPNVSLQTSKVKVMPKRDIATAAVETEDGINVRTKVDKELCRITGSTMMKGDTTLAIADENNCSVKLVDVKQKSVVSQITVSSKPWDITQVQPDQLAVTLYESHKIQFLTVTGTSLSLGRELKVSGLCRGIVHSNGKLFVSITGPGKCVCEILNMSGSIRNTISPSADGQQLLKYPLHLTLSADQSLLYVSDFYTDTVVCLDVNGKVKATYKDQRLVSPYGVSAAEDGSVIMCGKDSNNMYVISADFTQGRVLRDQKCGLVQPVSVTYSSALSTLYVGQDDCDMLMVFKLK